MTARSPVKTDPESRWPRRDRKSTRLNSSHDQISYAVFCLKKQIAPVGDRAIHTVRDGCRIDLLLVAPADHAKPRAVAEPPHHRSDGVAVRVRFAHDSVADDPDPNIAAHHAPAIWAAARSAAPSAAAASCASAPWRGSPRTWRGERSAPSRRAPQNRKSAA